MLDEIQNDAVATQVWRANLESDEMTAVKVDGISTKGWVQSAGEIEWGIRAAWRNSRKCIMRAFHQELK
jgi:nitric oxide synthase oxygenase domain/subunit